MIQKLAQFTDVRVALVVGGLSLQVQASTLRTRPEILVATPVRPLTPPPPHLSRFTSFTFFAQEWNEWH